jgi:hypothetical protein
VENEEFSIFLDITPRIPLKVNRLFRTTCRLHVQGRRRNQARNHHEKGSKQIYDCSAFFATYVTLGLLFDPEDGGDIILGNAG